MSTTLSREDGYAIVEASPEFRHLRSKYRRFIFPMGAAFLAWYFLLMYMAGWHHEWMAHEVWGAINNGMVFALSQFVTTFGIAWLYTWYADNNIDPEATRLKGEVERIEAGNS